MTESITSQDVYDALKRVKLNSGQPEVRAILNRVAGVHAASELRPDQYAAVIAACGPAPSVKPDGSLDSNVIFARWNASGKLGT